MILTLPLSVIDFETTGNNPETDQIIQFAITKIYPDGTQKSLSRLVKPSIPIHPKATEVHKITEEMLIDAKPFAYWAPQILGTINDTDILTYNGNEFDVPLFYNEMQRIGHDWDYSVYNFIDAYKLIVKMEPRTLSRMFAFYFGREMTNAHDAQADTEATGAIFLRQLEVYPELPKNIADLALFLNDGKPRLDLARKFKYNDEGQIVFTFGKHKDKTIEQVREIDFSYFSWFIEKTDFPKDSKNFLSNLLTTIIK